MGSPPETLRPSFVSKVLFDDKQKQTRTWVDRCEENVLVRPLGGSGDSCIVSRLKVFVQDEEGEVDHAAIERQRKRISSIRHRGRLKEKRYIVKRVIGPSERHAERDSLKSEIKRISYKVEGEFLTAALRCELSFVIAQSKYWHDESRHTSLLIEDDLVDLGFPLHEGDLNSHQTFQAVDWLARFHSSRGIWWGKERAWERGGYWSLDKRTEEYRRIRKRWKNCLEHDKNEGEDIFVNLPLNLAVRLELSAKCLDDLLYPRARELPFGSREEREAYDSYESEEDTVDERRDEVRKRLAERVRDTMLCELSCHPSFDDWSRDARKHNPFSNPTVIHGDFKAENIFFSETDCAVCDFQWVGFGIGVLDIASLVYSSLQAEIRSLAFISQLLDRYCKKMRTFNVKRSQQVTFEQDRRLLDWLFDWALVDYSRYVVGSGLIFPEDEYFLTRCDEILSRLDHGSSLGGTTDYAKALAKEKMKMKM